MKFSMSNQEYDQYVKEKSPNSKIGKNCLLAFLIGGLICAVGQLFSFLYTHFGFAVEQAATLTSVTMIFFGALLTGLNLYDDIAKYGGAGTIVPITGFANGVVSSAIEARTEGWILGIGTRIFAIAGPVILYGTTASMVYGLLYYFWTLFR